MKSGFVSLVGRPNVGKSTLINSIIGYKVAITSDKVGTTRNIVQGIYTDSDTQIVFVDTPGIHKPNNRLGQMLNEQAYYSLNDVDIILFLIDVTKEFGRGDNFILEKIKEVNKPVFLILNKVDKIKNQYLTINPIKIQDKIKKDELFSLITKYKDLYDFKEIIPLSAIKNKNVDELINTLKKYLPDNVMYYPESDITNTSLEFRIAELIREKVLRLTKEEVPHAITCVTENLNISKDKAIIDATIIVERDSLKSIIIGKGGSMLKEIGSKARSDIEDMLDKKVYLNLYVKSVKNWRDKEKYLKELGFYDIDEDI